MGMFRWDNLQSLLNKAEAKRALGTYGFGFSGLGISSGIQAAGQDAGAILEPIRSNVSLVERIFPELFDNGTMEIVNGKWFIAGMAFSDMISITLGLISCGVIIIRLVADLDTWLYRRKMDRRLEKAIEEMKKKK